MRTTGFVVDSVIRGEVKTRYLEVHLKSFVDSDPIPLQEGEKYYVLLSADYELRERLNKSDAIYYREALNDEKVVAIVDLSGDVIAEGSDSENKAT
jgi:hypothetical protein